MGPDGHQTEPLLLRKATDLDFGHPFDAAPSSMLALHVHPDGRVQFQLKLSVFGAWERDAQP